MRHSPHVACAAIELPVRWCHAGTNAPTAATRIVGNAPAQIDVGPIHRDIAACARRVAIREAIVATIEHAMGMPVAVPDMAQWDANDVALVEWYRTNRAQPTVDDLRDEERRREAAQQALRDAEQRDKEGIRIEVLDEAVAKMPHGTSRGTMCTPLPGGFVGKTAVFNAVAQKFDALRDKLKTETDFLKFSVSLLLDGTSGIGKTFTSLAIDWYMGKYRANSCSFVTLYIGFNECWSLPTGRIENWCSLVWYRLLVSAKLYTSPVIGKDDIPSLVTHPIVGS